MSRIAPLTLGDFRESECRRSRYKRSIAGQRLEPSRLRFRPQAEPLEDRQLLATPGYDYLLSGYKWQNPAHITYSVAPDGVFWDHGTNNVNATFNSRLGQSNWQRQIARALATWQSVANINITPVSDGGYDLNVLGLSQGDSRFGDIRIGGYVFPNNHTTLAQTYFPPPNGSTAAGDVEVNTSFDFNIGTSYDLYSVLLHELGHSLGLGHPPNQSVVMGADYGGVRSGLTDGDIAGIQAIYGPRTPDAYTSAGFGSIPSVPIDLSASLSTVSTATIPNLQLTSIGGAEYFTFVAPAGSSGSLTVTAVASNISMLSPLLSIYDEGGNLISQASDPNRWSNDVTATVAGVVPGRRYAIVVTGATHDVFDVGAYSLTLSLPNRVVTTPVTPTPNPTPPVIFQPPAILPDRYEPNGTLSTAARLGRVSQISLTGLTLVDASDVDYFSFRAGRTATFKMAATGTWVSVYNSRGKVVATGWNSVSLTVRTNTQLTVKTSAPGTSGVASYGLSISTPAPTTIGRKVRFFNVLQRLSSVRHG